MRLRHRHRPRPAPLDANGAAESRLRERFLSGELDAVEYEQELHNFYGLANYDRYGDLAARKAVVWRADFVAWTRGKGERPRGEEET